MLYLQDNEVIKAPPLRLDQWSEPNREGKLACTLLRRCPLPLEERAGGVDAIE